MSPRIKTGRITAAYREIQTTPPGSFPPHMQHLRPQRRARTRQAGRAVRGDRVNDTVALVRSLTTPPADEPIPYVPALDQIRNAHDYPGFGG